MSSYLTLNETARYLGISNPTVLNWSRQGYLSFIKHRERLLFHKDEVRLLFEKIERGEIDRLNARANKKNSRKTFLPDEYLSNPEAAETLSRIIYFINEHHLKIGESIFTLALSLLVKKRILQSLSLPELLKYHNKNCLNNNISQELNKWQTELDFEDKLSDYDQLLHFLLPDNGDILGLIYQGIKTEGSKSKEGSYYTPDYVCEEMVEDHAYRLREGAKILDPCCGTGQFLVAAAKVLRKRGKLARPENLWGYDIDAIAIKIARMNLMMLFPDFDFNPNIYQRDFIYNYSLDDKVRKYRKFDLIVGNPPWGSEFRFEQLSFLKENYPRILTMESYSYFVFIAMNMLSPSGSMSFILPESILNVKTHRDIRQYIMQNAGIRLVKNYGRIFKNVYTSVVRIDMEKNATINSALNICFNGTSYSIDSHRFLKNKDVVFDIYISGEDQKLIHKIYEHPHTTLSDNADWVLGIVTGNNAKFIAQGARKGWQKIIKGPDIEAFSLRKPSNWILFERDKLQQCAPLAKYKVKEKLIYRFISNRLVFAYDDKQLLTLNSANVLIPEIPAYPLKAIMALFNSTLYQFLFRKKFFTHKVLRGHLEQLPLPSISEKAKNELVAIADKLNLAHIDQTLFDARFEELDQLVFDLFHLFPDEKSHILNTNKSSGN